MKPLTYLVPFLVSSVLLTTACGGGPTPGVWRYDEYGAAENTCNSSEVDLDQSGDFRVFEVEGSEFKVDPLDGTDIFDCDLDGDDFDCPDRHAETIPVDGVDATLDVQVRATGTFESSEAASGTQVGTVTCSGSGCAAVAAYANTSFPCRVSVDFEASLDEAE